MVTMNLKVQVIKEISMSFYNFWESQWIYQWSVWKDFEKLQAYHHEIQKDILNVIARETSKIIIKDLDNEFFSTLVDKLRDISMKDKWPTLFLMWTKKELL